VPTSTGERQPTLWRLRRPAGTRHPRPPARHIGNGQVKLDANWVLLGAPLDINAGKFDQTRVGLGYIDDCLILG
jgi:hypothetical protein